MWLLLLGVRVIHGRPFHPQTQGKDERFHRTLKSDLLARRDLQNLAHAQLLFDAYRRLYNHERPHQALGDATPASRYRPSPRAWREPDPAFEYSPAAIVRRVKAKGEITWRNRCFYLGAAFRGHVVGLVPTASDGVWAVHFHAYPIGQIDLHSAHSKPKGNYYPLAKLSQTL